MRTIIAAAAAVAIMLAGSARADEWPPSFARVHLVPATLGCAGDKLELHPHFKTAPRARRRSPSDHGPGGRNIFCAAAAIS